MRVMIAMAVALMALSGCTDAEGTVDAAEALGLRDVRPEGHAWFGCGQNDNVATKFTATNPRGERVEGVVCSQMGLFGKASTVRIFGRVGA